MRKYLAKIAFRLGYPPRFLRLRRAGYARMSGVGVEVGAFEHPAALPATCKTFYADVLTPDQAAIRFPEVDHERLVTPHVIIDVDAHGMSAFRSGSLDFAIACHVIEHVANPGRFVAELVRVLRPGGRLAIAAPDKNHTYDRLRAETALADLYRYYVDGRRSVSPSDYEEMLVAIHPEVLEQGGERIAAVLNSFHVRREHLSVWTAASFRTFLTSAFGWAGARMEPEYEVLSDVNQFEYFGVWRRRDRQAHRIPGAQ